LVRAGNVDLAVPIIAAYLTFFPVTIYTLRGLTSVPPTALELMQSYAASRREILLKLRLPNALPHIFTALKISATASVVGAIIGELPSGIQTGLGIAILNFSRYYNQSPPRLWATILAAGLLGILFFAVVALVERLVVRWKVEESS
jgi:NitT/TauT family transport system permease protein